MMILAVGLIIVVGQNLLDIPESVPGFKGGFWWDLLHSGRFAIYPFAPNHVITIIYPFVPWLGLMLLGYCSGIFFTSNYSSVQRQKILVSIGLTIILFFVIVRFINIYGDPAPWSVQKIPLFTFFSFINVTKYPPSLLYTLVTLGIMFLVLSFVDGMKNRVIEVFSVYGKVPLFYYIIHWYLVHSLMVFMLFMQGYGLKDLNFAPFSFGRPQVGEGVELPIIYAIWVAVIISLYPLCLWYGKYKTKNQDNKWLRYL